MPNDRKLDARVKIHLGGLVAKAGIHDLDPALLYGALLTVRKTLGPGKAGQILCRMDEGWRDVRCALAPCRGFSNANKKLILESRQSAAEQVFWCRHVAAFTATYLPMVFNLFQVVGLRVTPRREKYFSC